MDLPLVAGDGVAQARVVPRVHDRATYLAEARLARHDQQRRVEQWVVLAEIFFALISINVWNLSLNYIFSSNYRENGGLRYGKKIYKNI